MLAEQEAGAKTADTCRTHGIGSATFHAWKARSGGMPVSDAKRLKALEEENELLKRLYAEAMRDELRNGTLFRSLDHAREAIAKRAADHNERRPHSALGYDTRATFAAGITPATKVVAHPAQTRRTTPEAPAPHG